jgi:FkbM family methyltransferase
VQSIFDIGMYDGADTAYYLMSGYRVVSVEANPELVCKARKRFEHHISSGQLVCVHAAISPNGEPVELTLSGDDLGSSTLFGDKISHLRPIGRITVPGITMAHLFKQYGVPRYLKVDIEGADRFCVLSLTRESRPTFLSFEIGADVDELLVHAANLGYKRFKIINQNSFREFANVTCLYDRVARRLIRYLGYADPLMIRRAGRFFVSGHSSGPVPWESDGQWRSFEETRSIISKVKLPGWNDIHSSLE